MNFWKKLFAGMGFVCGFLVFEAMSLAYHNSSRRCAAMWHRRTENSAAIAAKISATPKTDG